MNAKRSFLKSIASAAAVGMLLTPSLAHADAPGNQAGMPSSANTVGNGTENSNTPSDNWRLGSILIWLNGNQYQATTIPAISFNGGQLNESDWPQMSGMMNYLQKKMNLSYTMEGNHLDISLPKGVTFSYPQSIPTHHQNSYVSISVNHRAYTVAPAYIDGSSLSPTQTYVPASTFVDLLNRIHGCHAVLTLPYEMNIDYGTTFSQSPKVISYYSGVSASYSEGHFSLLVTPTLAHKWAAGMHIENSVVRRPDGSASRSIQIASQLCGEQCKFSIERHLNLAKRQ